MPKIMRIYYDNAGYPYKDSALSVRYPIVEGNEFTGANNTTEVHFYTNNLSAGATWVANCKLPNSELVNRLLIPTVDEQGVVYQKLLLDRELTNYQGHLKIGLNGYAGNISIDEEELDENNIVVISGTPTIIATGIVDIAMNYNPVIIPLSNLTTTEYEQLLAIIGSKLDITKGIYVVEDIVSENYLNYALGQILYDKESKLFYRRTTTGFILENIDIGSLTVNGELLSNLLTGVVYEDDLDNYYTKTETDNLLDDKVDKTSVYTKQQSKDLFVEEITILNTTTIQDILDQVGYGAFVTIYNDVRLLCKLSIIEGNYYLNVWNVYGLLNYSCALTDYFEDVITQDGSLDISTYPIVQISGSGDLLGDNAYKIILQDNSFIKYNDEIYVKSVETNNIIEFIKASVGIATQNSGYYRITKKYIDINKSTRAITIGEQYLDTYDKGQIDTLFTSALKYKGSKTVAELNALTGQSIGDFYNVTDTGILTAGNIEVYAGDNVAWTGSSWDKLTMDLSIYDDKFIAAGFFEVEEYDEENGTITLVYASDLYDMSYSESTGILTIEAN